jgi:DNA-binding GntR family transcriptional regulator
VIRVTENAAIGRYGRFERAQEVAAYEGLRDLILSRAIAAGEPLDVARLSDDLDVEPEQLRSAITQLASELLVVRNDSGEFCAAPVTAEIVTELFDARTVIEIGAIDAYAARIDEGELDVLESRARELAGIVAEPLPDLERFLEASHDYHAHLVGLARSAPLSAAYVRLGISRLWRAAIADLDWWNLFDVRHHGELTDALRARDVARAKALVYEHQEQVKRLVHDVIDRTGGSL